MMDIFYAVALGIGVSCAPLLLSFYENYGFKRFATFSFIRAVHCGLPFVMQKWR